MSGHEPSKIKMAELMLQGIGWAAATEAAGVVISRASAYRFMSRYNLQGEGALEERRRGHAYKIVGEVLEWVLAACKARPDITGRELQADLLEHFGLHVSKSHLNRVRGVHGIRRPPKK